MSKSTPIKWLVGAVLFSALTPAAAQSIDVRTNSEHHNHRFEAWGTSLAWWGNEVGGQSNAQGREDLIDLFFDPNNGLGMNFVRYNIGAGSNPDTSVQNITRPGAVLDGWVPDDPNPDSTAAPDRSTWVFDWNADPTQRLILDMAIEHGVTQVEAFANSAPWWMTRNEQSNGISSGSNLSTARNDDFAYYMLEVVEHFENNLGIHFETLAPLNEPGSGFWNGNSNQEGMGVPAGFFQDRLIKEFGSAIEDRGLDLKLVGLEETSTDQSADSWTNPNLTDEAKAYVDQFNTHTYGFNGGSGQSDSERLFDAVSQDGLKIYATEYGTGTGATRLARQINSDIRYLDAAGWTYWQAIEDNNGSGWGLAISNFNGNNPRFDVQDQYFAFKQFSAHIRPGSEIIELADQDNITAAYDPRTNTTSLVVNNEGADDSTEQYSFALRDLAVDSTRLIRTTDENNSLRTDAYQSLGAADVDGINVSFESVGNSVTTLVVHHQLNLIRNGNFHLGGGGNGVTSIPDWESAGDAAFDTGRDNTTDVNGTHTARLETQGDAVAGRIFQRGIGDADTDLSGVAFQLSADIAFLNAGNRQYDADTFLALEFYGADDETLASVSLDEFETEIEPAPGVKRNGFNSSVDGSDPDDDEFRTYVSGRFVAPEGTRYVRPVFRFDSVGGPDSALTYIDNARLQEVHPEAAAREWNLEAGGTWEDTKAWLNNSQVENNSHAYFGNAINEDSTVTSSEIQFLTGLTFFSDHAYHLDGAGTLLFTSNGTDPGLVDVRWGDHRVSLDSVLIDALNVQVLPDTTLRFDGGLNLNGQTLRKLGDGTLTVDAGFELNGGLLQSYSTTTAKIELGADAVLNGDFELLAGPGQTFTTGNLFELVSYPSLNGMFDNVFLPELPSDQDWLTIYGETSLLAIVIDAPDSLSCDFDADGDCEADDLATFYATGDLQSADIGAWLAEASLATNPANPNGNQWVFGDLDLNGDVDSQDLGVLLNNFDSTTTLEWTDGNLDDDGQVTSTDLGILLNNFGQTAAAATAVPEPSGMASMLALIALGFFTRGRRRA